MSGPVDSSNRDRRLVITPGPAIRTDVHNHVIPPPVLELFGDFPAFDVEIRNDRWQGGNHVDFDLNPAFLGVDAKLAELDENEIDRAVLSAAPPLFYYELGIDLAEPLCEAVNRGLREFHAAAPDRLLWMAHVPMQSPSNAVRMLEAAAVEDGCVGVEIGSSIAGRRLDELEFEPFWDAAEELSLPVMIHPDLTYTALEAIKPYYLGNVIGMPLETTITVERLIAAGVFSRHPDLRVLLVHGGGYFPYQGGRLKHAATVRPELADSPPDPWTFVNQLWFDVITHDEQALAYLVSRVGADRVVLGTDLPFDMALRDPLLCIERSVGSTVAHQIAAVNPAELFGLEVPGVLSAKDARG